ncbi:hypothetical protein, partial [Pseudomonas saliphila]|uniref:hypothetical protein n=1 Tax=Pseudomonas saliphila TaxID=2586906 RepID=UPI0019D5650B
ANLDVVINDPFNCYKYLHGILLLNKSSRASRRLLLVDRTGPFIKKALNHADHPMQGQGRDLVPQAAV